MGNIYSHESLFNLPRGSVGIRSFCSPEEIHKCTFDCQFAFHAHYKLLYTNRKFLKKAAEQPDSNIVLALAEQNHIIGYAVLAYPDSRERWADLRAGIMLEDYRQMLIHAGFDIKDVSVRSTFRYCPSLAKCILAERDKMKYSTIVLGRQGLSRSEEFLFGSVSSKIVNHARGCTAWVVE